MSEPSLELLMDGLAAANERDLIADIIACVSHIKLRGEEPNTLIMPEGRFPLRVRVKGTSKQRKRARFINRKVRAQLEAYMREIDAAGASCAS